MTCPVKLLTKIIGPMKKFLTLFLLLSMAGIMVSAQQAAHKSLFDAMNRVIRDESGKRIVYGNNPGRHASPQTAAVIRTTGAGESSSAIAVCAPQWFQGTMGACIGLNSMITGDLDHDGNTEILCGAGNGYGSGLYWYVMRFDAQTQNYTQTWMSTPTDYFSDMGLFTCIRAFDIDNDNIFEIFVGYASGLVEIYKGSDMSLIRSFYSGTSAVNDILFADVNNDGQKEVVCCNNDHTYLFNSGSFSLENTLPYGSNRFAAGNVDADPAIEIVYSNGTILQLNGNTPVVEWNIYTPLLDYALVALTDTDNDGMEEVIIAKPWAAIEIYDADLKTLKGTITTDLNIDAMIVADVNGDGKKEILYGDGQWGSIFCYNSLSLQQMWSIPNPEHGVTQIAVADADHDGQLEVLWGAGCTSSGSDYLYVHNIANQALEFQSKDIDGPFYAVETGDVDGDGHDEIVTVSAESESDYDSGILSIFDGTTGKLKWQCDGNFFPGTWDGIHTLKLANVTGDATKEIIVGTDNFYDGIVYIVSGVTHQILSSSKIFGTGGMNAIMGLDIADADGDGTPELVLADNNGLLVVNPANWAVKWSVPLVPGYSVTSVMVGNVDSDPNPEIIVCKGLVSVYDGVTHELWTNSDANCTNIDLYDWNNDGVKEIIACTDDGQILLIDRQTGLTTLLLQPVTARIDGIRIANLDGTGSPEFIFTSGGKIFFANAAGEMLSTNSFGSGAGSYGSLKLADLKKDGVLEIMAGTYNQVVQVSQECSQCLGFRAVAGGTNASCTPGNDGSATAVTVAGTAPYTFRWSTGSTQQTISGLAPGQYTLQATDSKGCPAQDTVTIAQSAISTIISGTDVGCHGIQDGAAAITIFTGTPPYQYHWSNGSAFQAITGLAPGTYTCVVSDHMGCSETRSAAITRDTVKIFLVTVNPACFGYPGRGSVQTISGTPPFVYLWGGEAGNNVNYNLQPGSAILTVRDQLNCAATKTYTITEPPQILLSTSYIPDDTSTPAADGQATVFVTGGTPPYYYQWDDPYHQTNSTATNLGKGHYTVTVYDYAGCRQTAGVDVFSLSVDEQNQGSINLSLFPNPASDLLNVSADFPNPVSGTIKLLNITGKVVDSRQITAQNKANFIFDLKGYPSSIYLVVLQTEHATVTRSLVITR